jgi:hypothetical protein
MVTGEESLAVTLVHWNHRILAIAVDVTTRLAHTPVVSTVRGRGAAWLGACMTVMSMQ